MAELTKRDTANLERIRQRYLYGNPTDVSPEDVRWLLKEIDRMDACSPPNS